MSDARLIRAAEQNRLARQDIEARDRALRSVVAHLDGVRRCLDLCNYGSAKDCLDALIDQVSDEFGTPLIVADAEERMRG